VLQELTTTQQEEALHNHRIEAGFVTTALKDASLGLEYILQEPLVVALPETHLLATETTISVYSLAHESFILFPRHLGRSLRSNRQFLQASELQPEGHAGGNSDADDHCISAEMGLPWFQLRCKICNELVLSTNRSRSNAASETAV